MTGAEQNHNVELEGNSLSSGGFLSVVRSPEGSGCDGQPANVL